MQRSVLTIRFKWEFPLGTFLEVLFKGFPVWRAAGRSHSRLCRSCMLHCVGSTDPPGVLVLHLNPCLSLPSPTTSISSAAYSRCNHCSERLDDQKRGEHRKRTVLFLSAPTLSPSSVWCEAACEGGLSGLGPSILL